MKRLLSLALLAGLVAITPAQYTKQGVRLLSQVALNQFPGSPSAGSAIYGWTSPSGREYAIIGLQNGNAVVDITNPGVPVTINHIPGPNSSWHENVTMAGYDYAVSDSGGAIGIQIIDLTNADNGSANLVTVYNGGTQQTLSNVHTIQADPTTKRLFANGTNRGFVIFNAANPTNLIEMGRWQTKYVHDCLIRNFTTGPFAGHQIAFLFCGTAGMYIVDVTNPASMITLGNTPIYVGGGNNTYCHSGSITPDFHYMLINDEFDENKNLTTSCTTIILDVSNLMAPVRLTEFASGVPTIDHNSHLRNGYLYLSAYKGGLRIYDAANPLGMKEVGNFDTYPSGTDMLGYAGNWGVYALFPSGNVILSDMQQGLFVLDPTEAIGLGAPISSLSGGSGVIESGGIPEARKSDDQYLLMGRATRTGGSIDLKFETTFSPTVTMDFTVEGKGGGQVTGYLKNLNTGNYDQVLTGTLGGSADKTFSATGLNPALYVNSLGKIDARVSATYATTSSRPNLYLDMAQVMVHRTAGRLH
jgi:choice-of-anchor B domain-containing protein